jgi:MOSC domain-containing protein YiiM
MVQRFLASGRTGFYLAVTREGEVGAGDEIIRLSQDPASISISTITRLYIAKRYDADDLCLVQRARELSALPDSWKQYLYERAARRGA